MENYFSESYEQCRSRFLEKVKFLKPTLKSYPIGGFFLDVAIFSGRQDKFLLHISGTHGPEGYAGSASQLAILDFLQDNMYYTTEAKVNEQSDLPTVVMVHALNPYGFATGRRVNEDNIDINRNFLPPQILKECLSRHPNFAGYETLDLAYNPTKQTFESLLLNDIWGYLKSVHLALRFGLVFCKRALVAGNYHKPTGIGYGGKELSASARTLIGLVNELQIPTKASDVVLIDVHSGLGPTGVDTLMCDIGTGLSAGMSKEDILRIESIFPTEYSSQFLLQSNETSWIIAVISWFASVILGLIYGKNRVRIIGGIKECKIGDSVSNMKGASSGYELTRGTVSGDFARHFLAPNLGSTNLVSVTQEFGTVNLIRVGKTQTEENYAFHYGSAREKAVYNRRNIDVFYVRTVAWKRNVARRGLKVFTQAFHYLKNQ